MKKYHQQAASLDDSDQNFDIKIGGNINFHQIGNSCLQYEMAIEKGVTNEAHRVLVGGDVFRLVINAFAYCFKEAGLSTTGGSDIEHNKVVGQIQTIMRALTSEDGDFISHLGKINETQAEIQKISLKLLLTINHDVAANKTKIKGQLPLEHIFGFCRTLKKGK